MIRLGLTAILAASLAACAFHHNTKTTTVASLDGPVVHTTHINQQLQHLTTVLHLDEMINDQLQRALKKDAVLLPRDSLLHAHVTHLKIQTHQQEPMPSQFLGNLTVDYRLSANKKVLWQKTINSEASVSFKRHEDQDDAYAATLRFVIEKNIDKLIAVNKLSAK